MGKRKQAEATEPAAPPPLRLEWRNPAELAENPANWRRHPETQVAALTDVIAEVGWAGACLYNEATGWLIDGHARRKVALEQGADKVPVLVGSWDEATEKKILATLDPLAAMAEANGAALEALLRDVQTSSQAVADMLTTLAAEAGVVPRRLPADQANDPVAEWQDMPEFEHEDLTSANKAIVHFATDEDLRAFEELVGQRIPANTKSIWYPKQDRQTVKGTGYVSDEP